MSAADAAREHQPLGRAAEATERAATLEDAAPAVVAAVCDAGGWPAGRLVAPPASVWHFLDPDRFELLRRALDATPALTATGRAPIWTVDVHPLADGAGVRGLLAVPVVVGSDVAAVLELYGEHDAPPDPAAVDLAVGAAGLLARVAERARASTALRHADARYRALAASTRDAIVTADGTGSIVSFTRAAEEAFGYWEDEVLGQRLSVLFPPRLAEAFEAGGLPALCGTTSELTARRRDGSEFPCELSLTSWVTSEGRFFTGVIRDQSDRRQAERDREAFEQQLAQRALHDPLTALPNRALLHDRLAQAAGRAARRGTSVAVVTLDLDGFKSINDTHGHRLGDELLVAVAGRLQATLRADDTVARMGGDEFALIREHVADRQAALAFAHEVADALAGTPFVVQGREEPVTATMGVALTAAGATEPEQTLRDAVVAMERARQMGRGQVALYDDSMRAELAERMSVEHDLRLAVEGNQLCVHYQPIVDLTSDVVTGVEALVRWEHPERGLLSPQQFIGLAEESGLILPLGRWVLEEACRQGAAWQRSQRAGLVEADGVRVSVNVSARQFQQPGWTDDVARALLATGFDPAHLVLEITESVLMEDTDTTSQRLGELKELGVRIAIDDFGTGYSSLGYLRRFPVDILKVDKSFIDGVAEGPHESALARAVIKLAATLDLDAVAEGVSTRKQLNILRRLRCRYAQGYYFARPLPARGMARLLGRKVLVEEGPERG
jgi:diguanylate cyclase (GGDEF)-like protein/PAS domain S-box-containing protein